MRLPSVEVLASWPKPNYVNPDTRGPEGKVIGLLLATAVTVILTIRLYARRWLTGGFGLDDTLISLAYIPATAFAIAGIIAEDQFQWDHHIWDVKPESLTPGLQLGLATAILFDVATCLTKLSLLAMLHRLTAASNDKKMSILVWVLVFIISINSLTFMIVVIFQCRPVSAYWTLSAEPQDCINEEAHLLSASIINTLTDFIVVLLPIKTVVALELPAKQRIIIIGLFGTGLVASASGIARTYFSWVMTTVPDGDTTWNTWALWFSSAIELYLGIICASVPATKPFFASYLPILIGSTHKPRSSQIIAWDSEPRGSSAVRKLSFDSHPSPTQWSDQEQLAGILRPLPPIEEVRHSRFSKDTTVGEPDDGRRQKEEAGRPCSHRAGIRFSARSTGPMPSGSPRQERTTVVIMYQGDGEQSRTL